MHGKHGKYQFIFIRSSSLWKLYIQSEVEVPKIRSLYPKPPPHDNRVDHPGEPVPEENIWTLSCKGRLTDTDTLTIRLGATPSRLTSAHLHHPHMFYEADALPAAQPTVSKY